MTPGAEPLSPNSLRDAFSSFATGVAVVSANTPMGPIGNTVSSFNTVSMEPPLVLFSLKRAARSFEAWQTADAFAVNVLTSEQADLSRRFAQQRLDKWEGVATRAGHYVCAPIIEGSLAVFECMVWARYDGGDHLIIVGQVQGWDRRPGRAGPLLFFGSDYHAVAPLKTASGSEGIKTSALKLE